MINTPKSIRLHIALFGRRNVGKSSLINALTNQELSIVSETPGTTTDPVLKAMELIPFGPVVFIDTAGIDDEGALGQQRVSKTIKMVDRCDLALLVTTNQWDEPEERLLKLLKKRNIPTIVVFNKSDQIALNEDLVKNLEQQRIPWLAASATTKQGIKALKETIIQLAPARSEIHPTIVGDLIKPGELVVLVTPIDSEAPAGRLILPQVQTIRDVLDHNAFCVVVKENELRLALDQLKNPPALVVTDSQAFLKVAAETPKNVPMTSFSILFARLKGDLTTFVQGAIAIERLRSNSHILVAEACTHHVVGDDIGRVKIPQLLQQYVGAPLKFSHVQGHDFPDELSPFDLVIHCGGCTINRRLMQSRILKCQEAGVPITNYGITIAYSLGIFERALRPFPESFSAFQKLQKSGAKELID
ncbi:MAG: [FeFe] hydrogenase H-cluster maturation GTPase HydF [Caldisericaceae bacterium]|nr:[FeFe] hydrogenase H-cluster maturation GTPase HydF [Caldisericaceae bacterium]